MADAVFGQRKEIMLLQRCKERPETGYVREGTGRNAGPVRGQLARLVKSYGQLMRVLAAGVGNEKACVLNHAATAL
jgi:hypothetical protein